MAPSKIKTAIIIPAYNEEKTIVRCVQSLSQQDYRGPVDIIIAANGCHDNTVINAKQAISQQPKTHFNYQVINLKRACKTHALNQAEKQLDHDVYIFLDADIELSINAISSVIKALSENSQAMCVAPQTALNKSQSKISKRYGKVWLSLPAAGSSVLGAGFVAVNKTGRQRWQAFPDIIADDTFIISHFESKEMKVIESASFTITLPEGFHELVHVRTRWLTGLKQLEGIQSLNIQRNQPTDIKTLISKTGAFNVVVYAIIILLAKLNYRFNRKKLEKSWFKSKRKV